MDGGGPTPSPDPWNAGARHEESVRSQLAQQFEQVYGTSDASIRASLGLRGRVADFVGRSVSGDWLIAESKGGDIGSAVAQLDRTYVGLFSAQPDARVSLRIYTSRIDDLLGDGLAGWQARNGMLGYVDEQNEWVHAARGLPIQVFAILSIGGTLG